MHDLPDAGSGPAQPHAVEAVEPEAAALQVQEAYRRLESEVHRVIVGQDQVLEELLMALLCGGHALLEGVPGLAKTLLVSTVARTLSLGFSRIQFTPDLMPSDMTGTEVIEEDKISGARELRFVKGPIFANVILADEINRTPPKTQAALLEAMQERQVTAGGVQHRLPLPFFVLATQNPIEQEGTYPLPEAQLDRFMFNIRVGYPTEEQELQIVKQTTAGKQAEPARVLTGADVSRTQELVRLVPVADHVIRYALSLVRATRVADAEAGTGDRLPEMVRKYLAWGAGPRASQFLVLAAKAKAILSGSVHVTPDHIRSVALPVLRHRMITNFNAEADGVTADTIVQHLLDELPVDRSDPSVRRRMDSVMR
jgi:MoxR-like ATPase